MNRPAPLSDLNATFLREGGQAWSARRLLRWAKRMDAALPDDHGPVVGVSSACSPFICAATLALWRRGSAPLLLDPSLRAEPQQMQGTPLFRCTLADGPRPILPGVIQPGDAPGKGGEGPMLVPCWPHADELAALFLTSGATGTPTAVRKLGRQLFAQMEMELGVLGVRRGVSVYSLAPPFHILGFVYGLFLPLLGGGRAAFSRGELQQAWLRTINTRRPDLVVGVPMHYRLLARCAAAPLPRATYFSSGAPMPPPVYHSFLEQAGHPIVQGYGSTETGGIARRASLGAWTPFPGLRWKVEPGTGRLMVRSPWQETPEQWHRTDDVVEPEGEGFRLLGRSDSVIKVAGKRFSTNEVVGATTSTPGVEEAAAVTYQRYGEVAVALFVAARPGEEVTAEQLRAALGQRLAAFKLPRTIRVLSELPRLSNGKVDLRRLHDLASHGGR